jgi:hypothetical protein
MKMFFEIHDKAKIDKERYKLPPKLKMIFKSFKILFTCKHVLTNITEAQ